MDHKLNLRTEGYSPGVLRQVVRQGAKAASFKDASEDLLALAEVAVSPAHVRRLSERVGREWEAARDDEVKAYRVKKLAREYEQAPAVAAVMLDGGRYQARAEDAGRGVTAPSWKETKVACCLTYAAREGTHDPQRLPPAKFRDRQQVHRLVQEMGARGGQRVDNSQTAVSTPRRRRRCGQRPIRRVRTVVATTQDLESFGWQVAAEVHRRSLDQAGQKACVADGSQSLWYLYDMHLAGAGFVPILDFVHLLVHLYAAAGAAKGKGTDAAWAVYLQWLEWAWSGRVLLIAKALGEHCKRLGPPPPEARCEDPRYVSAETARYVENNSERMDYPSYRRRGLPISSAPVESTIKQINRRVKGSEKFWLKGQVEAILQIRAAYLSEDGRTDKYWNRPRPNACAVGKGRLSRPRVALQ